MKDKNFNEIDKQVLKKLSGGTNINADKNDVKADINIGYVNKKNINKSSVTVGKNFKHDKSNVDITADEIDSASF